MEGKERNKKICKVVAIVAVRYDSQAYTVGGPLLKTAFYP